MGDAPADTTNAKFEKGGAKDISDGPLPGDKRGCTDCPCIIVFAICWVAFVAVTMAGFADGNPSKLYLPRDFSGAFCGVKKNWNDGPDLERGTWLAYTMNTTTTGELIAREYMCSQPVKDWLFGPYGMAPQTWTAAQLTSAQRDDYECACCHIPCSTCDGSLPSGSPSSAGNKIGELTSVSSTGLFNPGGSANGDMFTKMWEETEKYFIQACVSTCDVLGTATTRTYKYSPMPDDPLYTAWRLAGLNSTPAAINIQSQFEFAALSEADCPYANPAYCVPFPGVGQKELAGQYCAFELVGAVVDAVGGAAADAFENIGANNVADGAMTNFGAMIGDLQASIDALIIVMVAAFVVGFAFMVILRITICIVVWFAIFLIFIILLLGGALCFTLSGACKGASLMDSGAQNAQAVYTSGTALANGADLGSEEMTGNGMDYRGVQKETRSGLACKLWNETAYTEVGYPDASLTENYCRNPSNYTEVERQAPSIWCFTTDSSKTWELCSPIGVIQPACTQGYAIDGETARDIMKYLGFTIWGLGILYLFAVCCLHSRIMLAIRVNEVAAMFIGATPSILLLPVVQAFIGLVWVLLWALSASFLISQVPDGVVPKESFATYAEAFGWYEGETWKVGACVTEYPAGSVWKTMGDVLSATDECSGNLGDITGIVPKCWRCATPRYFLDWRFAVSFFNFLWNNAFLIAFGQCATAGAVGIWFFAKNADRGLTGKKVVRPAIWNCFRYHLGSLLVGSFILAVVQFIRYLMKYFEKQAEVQKNKILVLILKVVQCCIYCFEKCIKFLNKNAYIQTALMGTNFCTSAKNAFFLIARNILRFGVVGMLGSVIHALGMLFITLATVIVGYFILTGLHPDANPVAPLVVYIALGYLVGQLFMNVFGLAVDTSLQCFIATEEMGIDSSNVPGPLKNLVGDKKPASAE